MRPWPSAPGKRLIIGEAPRSNCSPIRTQSAPAALKSYSHDSVATANLLMAHNLQAEAEEAYRLATRFWPDNPESTVGLADLLASTGRPDEARQLLNDFAHDHPDQQEGLRRHSAAWRLIGDRPP